MYFEEKGAYTGEIAPAMLVDAGVKYVILGHSERRDYFGETSEDVNKKVLKAFEHGITPIMCLSLIHNLCVETNQRQYYTGGRYYDAGSVD